MTQAEINDIKNEVKDHDQFINGVTPSGWDGARSRLTRIEDSLARRDKASNYIIGACITIIVGVILWVLTEVIPSSHVVSSIAYNILGIH